jgi:hypothetical protein
LGVVVEDIVSSIVRPVLLYCNFFLNGTSGSYVGRKRSWRWLERRRRYYRFIGQASQCKYSYTNNYTYSVESINEWMNPSMNPSIMGWWWWWCKIENKTLPHESR